MEFFKVLWNSEEIKIPNVYFKSAMYSPLLQCYLAEKTNIQRHRQLLLRHPEDTIPIEPSDYPSLTKDDEIYLKDTLKEYTNSRCPVSETTTIDLQIERKNQLEEDPELSYHQKIILYVVIGALYFVAFFGFVQFIFNDALQKNVDIRSWDPSVYSTSGAEFNVTAAVKDLLFITEKTRLEMLDSVLTAFGLPLIVMIGVTVGVIKLTVVLMINSLVPENEKLN